MLKKHIKYVDYNGEEREEDFYFNLSKAEIAEMELSTEGGLVEKINRISSSKNMPQIAALFKEIILKSYGEKSPDGKRFIKSAELSEAFCQTEAYSDLFMELASNAESAADFIKGIIPADVRKQIESA